LKGAALKEHPLGPDRFFALEGTAFRDLLPPGEPVWDVLGRLADEIRAAFRPNVGALGLASHSLERTLVLHGEEVIREGFEVTDWNASKGKLTVVREGRALEGASVLCAGASLMDGDIEIGPGVLVEPGAFLRGPARVAGNAEIRQGAYLRGSVWVGEGCVVGHATEVKNSVFLDGAKAGHFAYVGDSVLGFSANLGAGTKLANLKVVEGTIRLKGPDGLVDSGRRKLGAVLGDGTETGCNSVTSPGALLAPRTVVYPNTTVPPGVHLSKRVFRVRLPRGEP
jgi:bifunctional N-acetylglucosamine-1-phosphate-uridyltransferase/glucosamine-1-phosphate-acetyltransferase GlmU-like protein